MANQILIKNTPRFGERSKKLTNAIHLTHQITFANDDQIMALGWRIKKVGNKEIFHHYGGTG